MPVVCQLHHYLDQQPLLSFTGAAFRLGERLVFKNTSWVMRRGEQWALIGANGSGKSLFADAVRGRLPVVQGEFRYHFRPSGGAGARGHHRPRRL